MNKRSEEQKERNRESARRSQRERWPIVKERQKEWRKNNPELVRIYEKRWEEKYPEKSVQCFRDSSRKWRKNNPLKRRAWETLRRAKKMMATPPWVDKKELEVIYLNCPAGYHVDHIIPLKHPLVCGLHVPWNLQYLSSKENIRKHNKFDPEHWR